jgi:hypothetical protein
MMNAATSSRSWRTTAMLLMLALAALVSSTTAQFCVGFGSRAFYYNNIVRQRPHVSRGAAWLHTHAGRGGRI